jgi:hypothetical protein
MGVSGPVGEAVDFGAARKARLFLHQVGSEELLSGRLGLYRRIWGSLEPCWC